MTVSCDDVRQAIPWLLDDELDPESSLEVEQHLNTCAACRAALEREGQLRLVLRRAAASVAVPQSLRNRIHEALEHERCGHVAWRKSWPAVAAAAILLSFMWHGGGNGSARVPADLEDLATRHTRDLPMDVVAGDVSQVQRYLSMRLPFAVELPQLDRHQPVKRCGGRIIHLNDHEAAYVRYDTSHGRVSMAVYPDYPHVEPSEVAPMYRLGDRRVLVKRVHGYTAAQWRASGMVYTLVTDLPENELPAVFNSP